MNNIEKLIKMLEERDNKRWGIKDMGMGVLGMVCSRMERWVCEEDIEKLERLIKERMVSVVNINGNLSEEDIGIRINNEDKERSDYIKVNIWKNNEYGVKGYEGMEEEEVEDNEIVRIERV